MNETIEATALPKKNRKTKKHPLKGRKQSPETIARRMRTLKLKRQGKLSVPVDAAVNIKDGLYFLSKAEKLLRLRPNGKLKVNGKDLEDLDLCLRMARRTLEGGMR